MSWWNSTPKQDKGESPAEISNKISQPVVEMVRRIDEEEHVVVSSTPLGLIGSSRFVDFCSPDNNKIRRLVVAWYEKDLTGEYDMVINQDWMTSAEKSAIVKAVKGYIVKTDSARKLTEREAWCKLMGVNQ